ncbi:Uncharacterised protein [Mycobacteroides abscessus subsp. abscessus]|nr:Uncharacterised protein [Mycobacteroides abscessus subsp. abscessus]
MSACRIIRPIRGSRGSRARRRPSSVMVPSALNAPSSCSSCTPSRMLRLSGGSRNGKFSISPSCSAAICRITAARLVRRISGSV